MKFWESELQQKLSRKRYVTVRIRRSLCFGLYAKFTHAVVCLTGDEVLCTAQGKDTAGALRTASASGLFCPF